MAEIPFVKIHGAGNDFVVLTESEYQQLDQAEQVVFLCHRKLGIGSDGLIVIAPHDSHDFEMKFFNPDGSSGMLCGNGARCAVLRAFELGWIGKDCTFLAADGPHKAHVFSRTDIEISMKDVSSVEHQLQGFYLHTGAPHYVEAVKGLNMFDVEKRGAEIRYHEIFRPEGTNANFIQLQDGALEIRTYERGVEMETLACGTGITAAALVYAVLEEIWGELEVVVKAAGGDVTVRANRHKDGFKDIFMRGPVARVFEGRIGIPDAATIAYLKEIEAFKA